MIVINELKNDPILEYSGNNYVVHGSNIVMANTQIVFKGKNNICFLEGNTVLDRCDLMFEGNDSLIYLRTNGYGYHQMKLWLHNNNIFHFGKDGICQELHCILSEHKHIYIGDYCAFSFGIWMRLADPHLIYNTFDRRRKNYSKSIFIGDHVWVGQNSLILKGSQIMSGSIVAANAVVANKKIACNTIWGGNPARLLAEHVFWDQESVHCWCREDTEKNTYFPDARWIYERDGMIACSFSDLDRRLDEGISVVDYLGNLDMISNRVFTT